MIRIQKKKNTSSHPTEESVTPRSERFSQSCEREEADGALPDFEDSVTATPKTKENPALSAAYRILQSGANSRKMLRDKLMKKGFSRDSADSAIAFCESQGLLSEKRLLLSHTEYLARKKHYGRSRIRRELLQKFDRQSVDEYFGEAIEEIDFEAYAKEEAARVAHRGKRYVASRLSTLGYSAHEIYESLDGLTFEEETSDT